MGAMQAGETVYLHVNVKLRHFLPVSYAGCQSVCLGIKDQPLMI